MIQFGNDKIKDIYYGSDKIKEVYYGSEKVWGEVESIQDGYWVHKDTGVITYFGLEDSSIAGGIMSSPSWKSDCSEVQIPSGVTGLGSSCFFSSPLSSINIPESVTSLGVRCFWNCSSLILITVLPATPPSLGYAAFDGVHPSFNIKVRSPYVNAYKAATNWTAYADKIAAIGTGHWVHYDTGVKTYFDLEDPSIENGIMGYPSWRSDCSEVQLPTGVIGLGEGCFAECVNLMSITLPESVTSLGDGCFYGCRGLELVTVLPAIPPTLGGDAFTYVGVSFNIKVRPPYVNDYKTATNWIEYESIISAI